MPIAGPGDIVIDKTPSPPTITIGDASHTSVNIQDIYDVGRDWEDDIGNIDFFKIWVGDGKQGLGGGDERPITITLQAPWVIQAGAGAGPATRIFTLNGGTIISDEESAGDPDPRSPFQAVAFVQYDRTKGQEGLALFSQEMIDMWTRLFGGRLYVDPSTGKEVIRDDAGVLFSEADAWSDDGVTPYDGTVGVARRDDHVKP
jgi:hypothetical protein